MKIAIVGQGIMGSLLAYYLSLQNQFDISVFDRDSQASSSLTAAGMLSPFTELEKSSKIVSEIGLQSIKLWPEIIKKIDANIYFKQEGSIVTAHPQDKALLQAYLEKINKLCDNSPFIKLNSNQQQSLEPDLHQLDACYFVAKEGQIDNQALMRALYKYLSKVGVNLYDHTIVTDIRPQMITVNYKQHKYDLVIDCRGIGDDINFSDLRAIRGEVIWLEAPEVNITRPMRLMHPRYSIYAVPRPNHVFIIGATEIESYDNSPISVRSQLELLSAALSIHKGFIEARIIQTATNLRPTLADGNPRIKIHKGLIAVNGLYRHGFMLAPMLANLITEFIKNPGIPKLYPKLWEFIHD